MRQTHCITLKKNTDSCACMHQPAWNAARSHRFLTGEGKRRLDLYSLHPTNNVWIYKATILHKFAF